MTPARKVALVAAGYFGAILLAVGAVAIRIATYPDPAIVDASSGMYAFAESLLFVGVFGVAALVPTGAALYFLRPYRRFWVLMSGLAVGIGVTSVVAAVLFAIGRSEESSALAIWASASVLRILVAPLCALTFFLFALLSPYRFPRHAFFAATLMEAGVTAYAVLTWFIPLFVDRA